MAEFAWSKGETRHRARQSIMHFVLEFCLTSTWPTMRPSHRGSLHGFISDHAGEPPQIGDLVVLQSTRVWSKWQIGWLRASSVKDGWATHVIESLEDGELCNWTNVGLTFIEREVLAQHPDWQWNDRQFAFKERWFQVCYKDRNAYITRPKLPVFGDGYSVTLGTREMFERGSDRPSRTFPDWRKVTKKMMAECYDQCCAEAKGRAAA